MEIWKDVEGYDTYQVSNLGKVRNKNTNKTLSSEISNRGYVRVILAKNGVVKHHSVHRLVAIAFIPNPENKREVNHINGLKTDNTVNNLEWTTKEENVKHAWATGLTHKEKRYKPVIQIDPATNKEIAEYESIESAKKNYNSNHIGDVCNGRRKTTCGYIWRFK